MYQAKAYSAASATSPLASDTINRREATETDVQIEILFCGICHSDLHTVRNEWADIMPTVYPVVPGHEIVGKVTAVGSKVTRLQAGRPGRRGLPGRLGPHLPQLQVRTWSSSAPKASSPTTPPTSISAGSPSAGTPRASSSTRASS